jgi:hypothetical protein
MAKFRSLDFAKDGPKIQSLKEIDSKAAPLKQEVMKLREQSLMITSQWRSIKTQLHALGTERQRIREELLASGLDPKLL